MRVRELLEHLELGWKFSNRKILEALESLIDRGCYASVRAMQVMALLLPAAWIASPLSAPSTKAPHLAMKAYYEQVDGINRDKKALELARKAVSGKYDGVISIDDAKGIGQSLLDGKGVTATEFSTAFAILRDYKFTPAGRETFVRMMAVAPPASMAALRKEPATKPSSKISSWSLKELRAIIAAEGLEVRAYTGGSERRTKVRPLTQPLLPRTQLPYTCTLSLSETSRAHSCRIAASYPTRPTHRPLGGHCC